MNPASRYPLFGIRGFWTISCVLLAQVIASVAAAAPPGREGSPSHSGFAAVSSAPPVHAARTVDTDWRQQVPPPVPGALPLERDGYVLWGSGIAVEAIFFAALLSRRRAWRIQDYVERIFIRRWLSPPICVLVYLLLFRLALLPLSYAAYLIDRGYGIAVQSAAHWFEDVGRSFIVNACILIPTLLVLLWAMRRFPKRWWLIGAAGAAAVSAVVVYAAPSLIDPLFHQFSPLRDQRLRDQILSLAQRAGIHVNGVYVGHFSSTTTEGNAYVTGLFGSERIVIWDTLLKRYPTHELLSVVAHELGHYALHHIAWGLAIGAVGSFILFFIISRLLEIGLSRGWIRKLGEPATLAPLAAMALLLNLLALPFISVTSRMFETQADRFSLNLTREPDWFIAAMQRLSRQDYDDPWPNPFLEFIFYSHPSISERIHLAYQFKRRYR